MLPLSSAEASLSWWRWLGWWSHSVSGFAACSLDGFGMGGTYTPVLGKTARLRGAHFQLFVCCSHTLCWCRTVWGYILNGFGKIIKVDSLPPNDQPRSGCRILWNSLFHWRQPLLDIKPCFSCHIFLSFAKQMLCLWGWCVLVLFLFPLGFCARFNTKNAVKQS